MIREREQIVLGLSAEKLYVKGVVSSFTEIEDNCDLDIYIRDKDDSKMRYVFKRLVNVQFTMEGVIYIAEFEKDDRSWRK